FPDPDLPPLEITTAEVDALRAQLPPLPAAFRDLFRGIPGLTAEDIAFLSADLGRAEMFAQVALTDDSKLIANWMLAVPDLHTRVRVESLHELAALVRAGTVSAGGARKVVAEMMQSADAPAAIVERLGLALVSDASAIETIAAEVIAASPAQTQSYRLGKKTLIGYFVGQVMKRSGGSANPQLAQEILRRLLDGGAA
ncbi:MAG TPA: Asp-tRNA(Asn)/Glu-tRNA(Gln) amidotransferase GatCAB subunit B, partial [Kofleriaceae bacterium]|nr:Asp-tRNA(Asn)/Glu-tRNA(Gln) amidotransferase GatCAB subunit B [Kofleriaceae bacterium]